MVVGADKETCRIGHRRTAPRAICTAAWGVDGSGNVVQNGGVLVSDGDPYYQDFVEHLVRRCETSWHNAKFDINVVMVNWPHMIPWVCEALMEGRIHCTAVREKLVTLSGSGNLRFKILPNGQAMPRLYDLATLGKKYLGKDRSLEKVAITPEEDDADGHDQDPRGDAWRLNFDQLTGIPASQYPKEAADYVMEDAQDTAAIFDIQEKRLRENYAAVGLVWRPEIEALHVTTGVFLYLCSAMGVKIDLERVAVFKSQLEADLSDDELGLMIAAGVLRPSQPARPHKNGALAHVEGCTNKKRTCGCPPAMTAPEKASIDTKALQALVVEVSARVGKTVVYTEPSKKFPDGQVSCASLVIEELAPHHPVLNQHKGRQNIKGLLDREVPRMSADPVHPSYNEIVSSFRVSCGATKLYASGNLQNVDPRARQCYPAEEGTWILSVDVNGMELVTLAQTVFDTFGSSTHRDMLNAGVDLHAYMAAQLAFKLQPDWAAVCNELSFDSYLARYEAFETLRKGKDKDATEFAASRKLLDQTDDDKAKGRAPSVKSWCKERRTFAKPINLGYPGLLGPATMVTYAMANYGLKIDEETAVLCRETWHEVHPDMKPFFDAVLQNRDGQNSRPEVVNKGTGETQFRQRFFYWTRMGALRMGCTASEAVNGKGLQSPGAELAKMGFVNVCLHAFDESRGSILYDVVRPFGFVHDEVLAYVDKSDHKRADACAREVSRLMVEGGQNAVPDVLLKCGAAYMERWNKDAEEVLDDQGLLIPWEWRKT